MFIRTVNIEDFTSGYLTLDDYKIILKQFFKYNRLENIRNLEKPILIGHKILKELTEYCFHPQRLLRLCHIYNIKISDYTIKLEKTYFLGIIIFKELTEYCFHPQRLLRLCHIYNVEMNDYIDII